MSVYKIIELVGSSTESWEKAAETAIMTASNKLKDLRIAEVLKQDIQIEDGKVKNFRVKLKLSFKYHGNE
jgi:flavin-binding protein dodecin